MGVALLQAATTVHQRYENGSETLFKLGSWSVSAGLDGSPGRLFWCRVQWKLHLHKLASTLFVPSTADGNSGCG